MTEHSLDFFMQTCYELKQEYRNKIEALGVKNFITKVGWSNDGEHVLDVFIICDEKIKDKIETLLPKEYKSYKVDIYYTFIE